MASAERPPENHPEPLPRRRGQTVYRMSEPITNRAALRAWRCAEWGLLPVAGLPLGLAAVSLGVVGLRRFRRDPSVLGARHAFAAVILGAIEVLVNLTGLTLIVVGLLAPS
jgi:hypothetical protein